jgi:SHS family sialic acid transporter-like MFS transporter
MTSPSIAPASSTEPAKLSRGAYLALTAALLGWMFDGAEMGVFSLVGRPAILNLLPELASLTAAERDAEVGLWLGVITGLFLVGAATGGVLFGWLGDRIGRVRAMTISVLTYAVFTSLCGFVTKPMQLGLLRFIASLGMGGEWSLGVALVMEVFPNRSRAFMAGLIGAAANVGYLLVAIVGLTLTSFLGQLTALLQATGMSPEWVEHLMAGQGWRVMMILGIVPALLTFFIRIFVPESEKWQEERDSGRTNHWATQDLLAVLVGCLGPALMVYLYAWDSTQLGSWKISHTWSLRLLATIAGLLMPVLGFLYPVLRYLQRSGGDGQERTISRMLLAACLSGVALLGTWGGTQQAPAWADKMAGETYQAEKDRLVAAGATEEAAVLVRPRAKEYMLLWLSVGAIIGTLGAAFLGDLLGRRPAYCLLCVLSLVTAFLLFQTNTTYSPKLLAMGLLAGICSASFYGWLPLYLPELFATRVRATGQGFGFNFGRVMAAIGSFQLGELVKFFSSDLTVGPLQLVKGLPSACFVLSGIYVVGMIIIWLAPETRGQSLPD